MYIDSKNASLFAACFLNVVDFTYRRSHLVSKNVKLPNDAPGCKCKGICVDPTSCECAARNGGDFPYVSRDGGRSETS